MNDSTLSDSMIDSAASGIAATMQADTRLLGPRLRLALEREIHDAGTALFEAARARHSVLATHVTVASVLAALAEQSSTGNADKDMITRALVVEHQRQDGRLWGSVLLCAYQPMLARLCQRIRVEVPDQSEREQLVVCAFLEVIASISPRRSWLCLSLRRAVERIVFRHLHGERQRERQVCLVAPDTLLRHQERVVAGDILDGNLWPSTAPDGVLDPFDPEDQATCIEFLVQHAGHVLDPTDLELVTVTLVHGERLTKYVERRYPDLEDIELRRTYQRLKRRHTRALVKLREVLADFWNGVRSGDAHEFSPALVAA